MSVFAYRAINQRAATVEGTISADSPRAARNLLRGRGLTVEQVTEQAEHRTRGWRPWQRRNRYAARRIEAVRDLSTLLAVVVCGGIVARLQTERGRWLKFALHQLNLRLVRMVFSIVSYRLCR
jgi:type II secretory pathway component PulF